MLLRLTVLVLSIKLLRLVKMIIVSLSQMAYYVQMKCLHARSTTRGISPKRFPTLQEKISRQAKTFSIFFLVLNLHHRQQIAKFKRCWKPKVVWLYSPLSSIHILSVGGMYADRHFARTIILTCNLRSKTPLMYRAFPVWFIKVTPIVDELVKNNAETRW